MVFDDECPAKNGNCQGTPDPNGGCPPEGPAQTEAGQSARGVGSSCPTHQALARLGHDTLDDASLAAIEKHVEGCPHCEAELDRMARGETCGEDTRPATVPAPGHRPEIPGFVIEEELGRGGMGLVYRAWDPSLERHVALKVIPGDPLTDPRARRRWLAEARAVSGLQHPNVVQLYHVDETEERLFLVLEYVPGGSLEDRLSGPLPPRTAARLMATIAQTVGHFHQHGLRHLDLKPSNILLGGEPDADWSQVSPKIADFGIARRDGEPEATATGSAGAKGTPSYMAPEQVLARPGTISYPADIYALGAILYKLLTGRPPFQGASPSETLDQVRGQDPVPPRRLISKIPRDLETIALKCLEKNPSRRYASAEALADDLNRFLEDRSIKARPVSPIEHAWRWCRRQPVIAALAATILLMLIGSFLGTVALLRRSQAERGRAEAYYQVASQSLDELLKILSIEHENNHDIYINANGLKALEIARTQEIELSKRYPLDIGSLKRLATIDGYLADFSMRSGEQAKARSLIEETSDYCEACLALNPGDVQIQEIQFKAAFHMLAYLSSTQHNQLYEQWNARAIAMLARSKSLHNVHVARISVLSHSHRRRADFLMLCGDWDRARKELEKDLDLVRSVPVAETAFGDIALSEALTLAALGQWSGEFPPPRSPVHPQPAIVDINFFERCLAELAARRIGWLPSIVKPPWLIPEDLPTVTWTDRVISSIKSDAAKFDIGPTRIPAIGWNMLHPCGGILAWQRWVGKLDDARRIADQLVALAERLTRSYPDQAVAYMLLSEGYVQKAKNAYREDESPVIEQWERKALDAALHAATLEPDNAKARSLVKDRRARLVKLASGE